MKQLDSLTHSFASDSLTSLTEPQKKGIRSPKAAPPILWRGIQVTKQRYSNYLSDELLTDHPKPMIGGTGEVIEDKPAQECTCGANTFLKIKLTMPCCELVVSGKSTLATAIACHVAEGRELQLGFR